MRSIPLTLPLLVAVGPARRLIFETDGQRVVRYRAGITPAVKYVEGCA